MKWLIGVALAFAILIVSIVVIAPLVLSKEGLTEQAEVQATQILNRDVSIGSVSGISLLPPRLTIENLSVANEEGFEGAFLVEVEKAQLGVRLWPLFSRRIEIETFVLTAPRIDLQQRVDGSNNYTLGDQAPENKSEIETDASSGQASAPLVGTIVIADGSVRYRNGDADYQAENVDATMVLPPLGQALKLQLDMMLDGVPTQAKLHIDDPWRVTETNSVKADIDIDVAGNRLTGAFDAVTTPLKLSGPVELDVPFPAKLEPLIGAAGVEAAKPFGEVAVRGRAEITEEKASFRQASYETALSKGTGDFILSFPGARPKLTGTLDADYIDIKPFFPPAPDNTAEQNDSGFPPWSDEAMDLSSLKEIDTNLTLAAGRVELPTYTLQQVKAVANGRAGLVDLQLEQARVFEGEADGKARLDARAVPAKVNTQFEFSGIDFAKAAPALLGTDKLAGLGDLTLDLATKGQSQKAWVSNVDGSVKVDMQGGSVLGIDLNTIASTGLSLIESLDTNANKVAVLGTTFSRLTEEGISPGSKTLFDLADMNLTLEDGVTRFGQGQIRSDAFRATFGGGANLLAQTIDLSIMLAAKAPDATSYRELKVPLTVGGTFNSPKVGVDTAPLVRQLARNKATDALGQAGIDVGDNETVGDALKRRARRELFDLFAGDDKDEAEKDEPQ